MKYFLTLVIFIYKWLKNVLTKNNCCKFILIISYLFSKNASAQKLVRYDLYVRDTTLNYTGKIKHAISVNGQIPMPTLTFTEGDTAEIYVHNELKESTSMHWHGLFLPNKEDGVPYLTQLPIMPHTTHLYKFPLIQNGTHWYHSHSKLQEQIGMYGNFIILKKQENSTYRIGIDDLPTVPIILGEWTDYKPESVHRMLHNATDWFAIKKGTTQSWHEAAQQGYLKTKFTNEWKRMNAMDVSDVFYDKFLVNGQSESQLSQFHAGDKIRLRIANGGASTYFWLTYAGGKIIVVANDGNDIEPVEVDRMLIAVSETYDIIIKIPDNGSYELLVSPEDRTKSASLFLGNGIKHLANPLPKLKYFEGMKMMNSMMKMNGLLDDMGMHMSLNQMDMNVVMYPEITGVLGKKNNAKEIQTNSKEFNNNELSNIVTLNYTMLKSPIQTKLPHDVPLRILSFTLSGNMNRYVWSLDNKVVSEVDKILIHKGENVRIILYNGSMMRHPMHLHGQDFRLLNGQNDYAPLKNIVDIMPMETDTIEFNANVYGDWFFHCHILYHMMSGMGRIFSNPDTIPNPLIQNVKEARRKLFSDDRRFHFMTNIGMETNGSDGEAMFSNTRWKFEEVWHFGFHPEHGYESETKVGRYFGRMQWVYGYAGFDYHYKLEGDLQSSFFDMNGSPRNVLGNEKNNWFGQFSNKNNRHTGVFGVAYTMPMLIVADIRWDLDGKLRLQFSREDIPLSRRLRMNWMLNSDREYMLGFRFIIGKNLLLSTHYDSDMGIGLGLVVKN
jgi:FtsP/CotA-like multicopper oxidase with cupredoxin domain